MFTDRKTTAKRVQSWLLTLLLGARSQGQGSGESGSNSNAAKKRGKASYMFTGHTAFLRMKLFCKEKLFIERSHLLIYSVCNNHKRCRTPDKAFEGAFHSEMVTERRCGLKLESQKLEILFRQFCFPISRLCKHGLSVCL